ncbi:uncharacterized protein H6S33_004582 [Morchella sextelata]|uniref:uncharacterized protein n=1 Tax=Morchella sextelata TaxID=1174677 RepID=UPI001D052212|nr:uncharacterized protein H6S33_004582 [Morchella sextelata]KAH0605360.1 hypothetical protein H6S33_004582 [Morchella sextelata]
MQPFLFRASSSLTRPSCGGFTSTIAVSYSYRALSDRADECLLKNKFGEFYKRFYSAVSGDAGPTKKGAGGGDGNGAIGSGEVRETRRGGERTTFTVTTFTVTTFTVKAFTVTTSADTTSADTTSADTTFTDTTITASPKQKQIWRI